MNESITIDPRDLDLYPHDNAGGNWPLQILIDRLRDTADRTARIPGWDSSANTLRSLADAIERQFKPDEPTGFGAVVQTRLSGRWTWAGERDALSRRRWRSPAGEARSYAQLDVVEVLSPGVPLSAPAQSTYSGLGEPPRVGIYETPPHRRDV